MRPHPELPSSPRAMMRVTKHPVRVTERLLPALAKRPAQASGQKPMEAATGWPQQQMQ